MSYFKIKACFFHHKLLLYVLDKDIAQKLFPNIGAYVALILWLTLLLKLKREVTSVELFKITCFGSSWHYPGVWWCLVIITIKMV